MRHRSGHKLTGITVSGAKIKSLSLSHGHLLITLVRPVASLTVKIKSSALTESAKLLAEAKAGRLRSLVLTVITESTNSKRTTIRVRIRKLGL